MKNQIFAIESTFWKSLVITDEEFWLSQNQISDMDKFAQAVQKTGMLKSAYAYPLTAISEISFNEASESIKLKYQNEKGKQKKLTMGFGDEDLSNQFGQFLGDQLGMTRNQKQEGQLQPLLLNLFYLALSIGGTIFLLSLDDTNELLDGGRRTRSRGALLKVIIDTIGPTGVMVIGGLISVFLMYRLYQRYQNPANEILYTK